MTVPASSIITRARDVLIDAGSTRWTDAELLRWLSDGERLIVTAVPAASARRVTVALATGTLQSTPADAYSLLSVERNNGASDGTKPGKAIRVVAKSMLDNFNPDWHSATPAPVALSATFDPNTPKNFYVSPPNDGTGFADIIYSQVPVDITSTATNISVDDIYQTPLVDYVLHRAFQKDADYATVQSIYQAKSLAQGYLEAFQTAVGITVQGRASDNPNTQLQPPPPPAADGGQQ